jgi:hypothetical protein
MNFNMKLDDDIVAVIDEDRKNLIPRRSRTAHIEAILYHAYKKQVDRLRKQRRATDVECNADATANAQEAITMVN